MKLNVTNHDRDVAGLSYVYPVVSRRAGGVSLGVNLNPNNACNYRCVYCQVPELEFGKGPPIELSRLESELRFMLSEVLHGDFMERSVPEGSRRLNDIAFSGNGEPTSSPQFEQAIEVVGRLVAEFDLLGKLKVILITNGTLTDRPAVQRGLARMAQLGGEVWFKLDSATEVGTLAVNSTRGSVKARVARLGRVARRCPTWIQTCLFQVDGSPPSAAEQTAYLELIASLEEKNVPIRGVLLYSLARPSLQPEAERLSALPESWLSAFAERIRALGVTVSVSA